MNLRSSFAWVRVAGLLSVLGLSSLTACDSDAKKAAPVKAEVDVKAAEPAKTEPVAEVKPVEPVADVKPVEPVEPVAEVKPVDPVDPVAEPEPEPETKPADPKVVAKAEPKKTADKAPSIDGKPLYDAKCKSCHAADGKGTAAMKKNDIPDMADKGWQGKHSKASVVKAIANGVDGTKMKAFKDKLKPDEIDAVAAYVKKLK